MGTRVRSWKDRGRADAAFKEANAFRLERDQKKVAEEMKLQAQQNRAERNRQREGHRFATQTAAGLRSQQVADRRVQREQSLADRDTERRAKLADDKTSYLRDIKLKMAESGRGMLDKDRLKLNMDIDKSRAAYRQNPLTPKEGEEGFLTDEQYIQQNFPSAYDALNQSAGGTYQGGLRSLYDKEAGPPQQGNRKEYNIKQRPDGTYYNPAKQPASYTDQSSDTDTNWDNPDLPTLQPDEFKRELSVEEHQADIEGAESRKFEEDYKKRMAEYSKNKQKNMKSLPEAFFGGVKNFFTSTKGQQ